MTYYPKSQIKTNLYTNGNEYIFPITEEEYIGYYYEVSTGDTFTGKNPNDGPNERIILDDHPIRGLTPDITTGGNEVKGTIYPPETPNGVIQKLGHGYYPGEPQFNYRSTPTPIQTRPTKKDYDLGVFSRYIVKKNNENIYLEINKEQFIKFQNRDEDVAWDLYTPKEILWQIKGDKTQTYTTNKNIIELVENRDKWYGFTQWFKDRFLKYYIGKDFHVMPDGSIMEGKTHEDGKNLNSIKLPKNTSTQSNSTTSNNPSGGGY